MSPLRLCACLSVALVLALAPAHAAGAPPSGEPQATTARACGTLKLALGKSIVRARNVRCADARRFITAYLNRDCGETRDCSSSIVNFRSYRCVNNVARKLTKNTCTKGRKVISELHG